MYEVLFNSILKRRHHARPKPCLLIALTEMALAGCASEPPAAAFAPVSINPPNSQLEHCCRTLGALSIGKDADLSGTLRCCA